MHPKDGVYPEKVNPGREGVGQNFRSIGKNVSPIEVKFTGKQVYDLEEISCVLMLLSRIGAMSF